MACTWFRWITRERGRPPAYGLLLTSLTSPDDALRANIARNDATAARTAFAELARQFADHHRRESAALTVDALGRDDGLKAKIDASRCDARGTSFGLTNFAASWSSGAVITRDLDRFRLEVEHRLAGLGRLMVLEERGLFPLLDVSGSLPIELDLSTGVITRRIPREALRRALSG